METVVVNGLSREVRGEVGASARWQCRVGQRGVFWVEASGAGVDMGSRSCGPGRWCQSSGGSEDGHRDRGARGVLACFPAKGPHADRRECDGRA